ncbi:hypothetical protein BHE17_04905 [Planococcus maritimus]|uniref:DUF4839 domain-containing protein n=1 Tax=Planococcus maritimus TaxID=192421 RepID=UPI00084C158E|nr:DUF4839 domain-containing protein [Planococcus maritimus]OED31812.1 hypothetical protein BHE17_04905 [Planococcus maritimus]
MNKFLLVLFLIITFASISACSNEENPDVLKVSKSSDEISGENYKTVISELEKTGFNNVETKVLDDLITGWLTQDGEIEEIEINGNKNFSANDRFPKDSKIVITYHTFPSEESDAGGADGENSKVDDRSSSDKAEKSVSEITDEKSSENVDASLKSNEDILTLENNEELEAVLTVNDTNDPIVSEFAKKYSGRTIEFDGYIANMMPHGKYKTRYDILINTGDYGETTYDGPDFKFEDVNIFDLNLTGAEIPETIGLGQNLRITAVVEEYDENPGLFFLNPISSEIR